MLSDKKISMTLKYPKDSNTLGTQPKTPVLIWHSDDPLAQAVARQLGKAMVSPPPVSTGLTHANTMLKDGSQTRVIMINTPLDHAVSQALSNDKSGQQALMDWIEKTQVVLRLWRAHRQRVILIDAKAAALYPVGLTQALELPLDTFGPAIPMPNVDPLAQVVSARIVLDATDAAALSADLQVSVSNQQPPVDLRAVSASSPDALYETVQTHSAQKQRALLVQHEQLTAIKLRLKEASVSEAALRKGNAAKDTQIQTLRAEQQTLQETIKTQTAHTQTLQQEQQKLRDTNTSTQKDNIARDAQIQALEAEQRRLTETNAAQTIETDHLKAEQEALQDANTGLHNRLEQMRAGFASAEAQVVDAMTREKQQTAALNRIEARTYNLTHQAENQKKTLMAQRMHVAQLEAENARIMSSTSMRLTAPLRWLLSLLRRRRNGSS